MADLNVLFEALSAADKRVAIAKDVLLHLAAEKILAERGTYLQVELTGETPLSPDDQVGDVIAARAEECIVCALGAMVVSTAKIADKLSLGQGCSIDSWEGRNSFAVGGLTCYRYLEGYFDGQQLRAIEAAFECGDGNFDGDAEVVLRNIMQNIVDHGGGFVPPPRDEYEDEDNYEDDD
jgi:hypothetical protein